MAGVPTKFRQKELELAWIGQGASRSVFKGILDVCNTNQILLVYSSTVWHKILNHQYTLKCDVGQNGHVQI
ncbi:unnamed protein product [Amaranthus hypochondriacus]